MSASAKTLGTLTLTFVSGKVQKVKVTRRGRQVYLADTLVAHGEPEIHAAWVAELKLRVTKRNPNIRDVTWDPA